jgi:hypothetical protein
MEKISVGNEKLQVAMVVRQKVEMMMWLCFNFSFVTI